MNGGYYQKKIRCFPQDNWFLEDVSCSTDYSWGFDFAKVVVVAAVVTVAAAAVVVVKIVAGLLF